MGRTRNDWPTGKQLNRAFNPYAANLGELVFHWNSLHNELSHLFELVIKSPVRKMGVSIWHSTDSDFAQRKMLRAATEIASHLSKPQREDILWVLNRIEDGLRHNRNDALHAPLIVIMDYALTKITVVPDPNSDSPRARALIKKGFDNLNEFLRENIELANLLELFSNGMFQAILNPSERAWPQRPALPHAHRKKSPKGSSRQNSAK
jgi:hypothetical protein